MKRKSQFLALFMALCLAVSVLAVPAGAEGEVQNPPTNTESGDQVQPGGDQNQSGNGDQSQTGDNDQSQTGDNDQSQTGGNDQSQTGGNDQSQTGGNDQSQTGGNDQSQTGGNDQSQTGGNDQSQTGGNDQSQTGGNDQNQAGNNGDNNIPAPSVKPTSSDFSVPSSIDFGNLTKGTTTGLSKTFTIRNTSGKTIRVSAAAPANYSISNTSWTLLAGESANITILLTSADNTGSFNRTLTFSAFFMEGNMESASFSVPVYAEVKDASTSSLYADPATKDLGKLKEGYDEKTAKEKEVTVTIKNNGGVTLRLNGFKGNDHFTVTTDNQYANLEAGRNVTFQVVPKQSLTAGTYTDTITFQTVEGVSTTFKPTVVIEKAVDPLTVEPATVDFGTAEEGYAALSPKQVTVKNNTDRALRLETPYSYSYEFSQFTSATIAAGGTATFTIRPRTGLTANSYNGQVSIQAGGESAKLDVRFAVNRKSGPSTFSDVAADSTFAADIAYVSQQGLMSGKGAGLFKPQDPITRGQLVTILYRLEGQPAVSGAGFSDVAAGSYCENAVKWAAASGVTTGGKDGTFKPNDPITREQLATFLYRYNNHKGYQVLKQADLSTFSDGAGVSSYARDAMAWANGVGLVNGTSDGRLNPSGGASRGQAAAILHRFCVSIGR